MLVSDKVRKEELEMRNHDTVRAQGGGNASRGGGNAPLGGGGGN